MIDDLPMEEIKLESTAQYQVGSKFEIEFIRKWLHGSLSEGKG